MRWVGLLLLGAGVASAGVEEARAALGKGDYLVARREFTEAAEAGDAEAQFELGEIYRTGLGTSANPRVAAKWYELAVAQGHQKAAGELGVMLWDGAGIKEDRERAPELLRLGWEGYSVAALHKRGLLHLLGIDVGLDDEECRKGLAYAANKGHADAQDRLARMLRDGRGGEADAAKAEEWFRKAAEQGHPAAHRGVGACLYAKREIIEALKWYREGALRGDFEAQLFLATAQVERGAKVEGYAWHMIVADPRSARDSLETSEEQRKVHAKASKAAMKELKREFKPDETRAAEKLGKEYARTIRANLKKPLPY